MVKTKIDLTGANIIKSAVVVEDINNKEDSEQALTF